MPDNANYQIKWQYENLFLLNKKKKKTVQGFTTKSITQKYSER